MANLSSGTQKRPGDRDADAHRDFTNGGPAKRSRRESPPAGDWRDVHLKGKDRDRARDDDRRSSRRRDDDYKRDHRDRDRGDYRRRRSRSRSRPVNEVAHTARVALAPPVDDEKEEGEISPRPPLTSAEPSSQLPASPRHSHSPRADRRRGEYPRRSRSRTQTARSRSRSRSAIAPRSASRRHHQDGNNRADDRLRNEAQVPNSTAQVLQKDEQDEQEQEQEQEPEQEKSIEDILAERKRKRAEILAKHASGSTSVNMGPVPGTPNGTMGTPSTLVGEALSKISMRETSIDISRATAQSRRESASPPPPSALDEFALAKEDEEEPAPNNTAPQAVKDAGQLNAGDYDPSLDRREDEKRRFGAEKADPPADAEVAMVIDDDEEEEVEVTDDEGEEEVDDMFAIAFGDDEEQASKPKKKVVKRKVKKNTAPPLINNPSLLVDSAADHEGYYTVILGEYLDGGRYQVFSSLGKGMFANVVRARVLKEEGGSEVTGPAREVAIKIIRCQEPMYKAGLKEAQILHKLRALDMEDKKHVVKLERTFEHRGHLCLVFENMSMNLREVVKRFGKDVGLNIRAVRAYAHQLFLALSLLRKANIMHADIKPDNILVNEQKSLLKLCDLGSASDASENDITPYLVSRFYRAPEIIMGVPYDPSLDVWSVGCTLYELYTGKILLPGRSNSHMLLLMMELKGRFNNKMIKKAKFGDKYFDSLGNFESVEKDRITGQDVVKTVSVSTRPVKDLRSRIMGGGEKLKEEESRMLMNFVDLLDKCLVLDPGRRITPREALGHAFIRG